MVQGLGEIEVYRAYYERKIGPKTPRWKPASNTIKAPIFLLQINTKILLKKFANRVLKIKNKISIKIGVGKLTRTLMATNGDGDGERRLWWLYMAALPLSLGSLFSIFLPLSLGSLFLTIFFLYKR